MLQQGVSSSKSNGKFEYEQNCEHLAYVLQALLNFHQNAKHAYPHLFSILSGKDDNKGGTLALRPLCSVLPQPMYSMFEKWKGGRQKKQTTFNKNRSLFEGPISHMQDDCKYLLIVINQSNNPTNSLPETILVKMTGESLKSNKYWLNRSHLWFGTLKWMQIKLQWSEFNFV